MIKTGDKVYYYQTMNRVGTVVEIITERNNQLTVGGTSEARVFVRVEYPEGDIITYRRGDIQKNFD
tara:strand:- start:1842 stop:2039 length:198 start_codon:yes stop_codon:yes gene_type:complete